MKPRALDLFCGAGGAGKGLQRAGFTVVGIDIEHQPNYDAGQFVQANALNCDISGFDFIWASPPCQAYSPLNAYNKKSYPDLVGMIRDRLMRSGTPYVIENVVQAPLINPVMLCGSMFGLRVYRHRGFEASFPLTAPEHPEHSARCARNGYLPQVNELMTITGGRHSKAWLGAAKKAMGVEWMQTIREVCEAIPPAYSEFIGRAALNHIHSACFPHADAGAMPAGAALAPSSAAPISPERRSSLAQTPAAGV